MRCELSLRALNLTNVAGSLGTSDPFAVVTHIATTPGDSPRILGRTEEAKDSLSPDWEHLFRFDWYLGTPMKICVEIFDRVSKKGNQYRKMGSTCFDVGLVLGSPGSVRAKRLKRGGILISRIRKGSGSGELRLKLKGLHLRSVDGFMKKADPFYEIHRRTENDDGFIEWERVYKSKTIMNNLNPTWPEVVLDVLSLGDGNLNQPIKIVVYDHEKSGDHEFIGDVQLSVNRLLDSSTDGVKDKKRAIPLVAHKTKGHKSKDVFAGKIIVLEAHIRGVSDNVDEMAGVQVKAGAPLKLTDVGLSPSFIDYVIGGCQFNVCIAVDFTGSNGDPLTRGTLHYLDQHGGFNDYEKSMIALLNILGRFDSDKHYALWGFGAKYNDEVHNIFQCGRKRLIPGIEGVLQTYRDQFRSGITMARTPTVFTDVIRTAAAHARRASLVMEKIKQQAYTVLIILTDGDVEDIEGTVAALDAASDAPLSIVFVGIGENDFSGFSFLDDQRDGQQRNDIAQFVEFNQHSKNSIKFTSEACQGIPQQLTNYFEGKGISPLPEPKLSENDLEILPKEEEMGMDIAFDPDGKPSHVVRGGVEYHDIFRELIASNQD